jgi:hypothetical protein
MRRLGPLYVLIALIVVLAAGCGSGASTNPLQLSGIPRSASCDKNGISTGSAAGTCTAGGTTIIVANNGQWLRMKDYAVQVTGVRTATHLGSRAASNFTPGGQFVVVTLRVRNSGSKAQPFDQTSKLAYLLADGTEYPEVQEAENELASSFQKAALVIKPGATATGTVVFDPPQAHAAHAGTTGSQLVFLNAEDSTNGLPRLGFRAIGFVRLGQ